MNEIIFDIYHHLNNSRFKEIEKEIINNLSKIDGFSYSKKNPDLIIILGGDGSLLHHANNLNYEKKFILINCGHLGFYSDYNDIEFLKLISNKKKLDILIEEIPCFNLTTKNISTNFVNDVYLLEKKPLNFELIINNKKLCDVKANGIVIGTSLGSSGYLNSLGLPLVLDSDLVLQFSFIAPITNKLNLNKITKGIINPNDEIKINISEEVEIFFDGIKSDKLKNNSFTITKSNKKLQLVHFDYVNNFDRIKKTFC